MSERPPPSPAQVALALAATGRQASAKRLIDAVLARDPTDEQCLIAAERIAQIPEGATLQPHELPRVYLGVELADAYVQTGLLREAHAIATALANDPRQAEAARRRVALLEQLIAPLPAGASAAVSEAQTLVEQGALASALLAYRDAAQDPSAPPWVRARAEALRSLLLSKEDPVRPVAAMGDETTRVGRDPRRIMVLLVERNLRGALEEARIAAARRPASEMAQLAAALQLLAAAAERIPHDSLESRSTLPMGRAGVANLHIRMGNFEQASTLYRAAVEQSPNDDAARETLEALRVVLRHLRTVSVETSGESVHELPGDVTRRHRVEADVEQPSVETGELVAPATENAPAPSIVEATLRKTGRRSSPEGFSPVQREQPPPPAPVFEDETAVTSPEVAAELALRQGYPERALAMYRKLARDRPSEARLARRVQDIERILGLDAEPPAARHPSGPQPLPCNPWLGATVPPVQSAPEAVTAPQPPEPRRRSLANEQLPVLLQVPEAVTTGQIATDPMPAPAAEAERSGRRSARVFLAVPTEPSSRAPEDELPTMAMPAVPMPAVPMSAVVFTGFEDEADPTMAMPQADAQVDFTDQTERSSPTPPAPSADAPLVAVSTRRIIRVE